MLISVTSHKAIGMKKVDQRWGASISSRVSDAASFVVDPSHFSTSGSTIALLDSLDKSCVLSSWLDCN